MSMTRPTRLAREVDILASAMAETFQDSLAPVLTCGEAEQLARVLAAGGWDGPAVTVLRGHATHDSEGDWHEGWDEDGDQSRARALVNSWINDEEWDATGDPEEED